MQSGGKIQWEIGVDAGAYYQSLADNFNSSDIFLGWEDDHQGRVFFASSAHVNGIDDLDLVSRRLYALQLLLNGAIRAGFGNLEAVPITFRGFGVEGRAWHQIDPRFIEDDPFDKGVPNSAVPRSNFAAFLLSKSRSNPKVRMLLLMLGLITTRSIEERILAWGTLYKVLETLKSLCSDANIRFDSLADEKRIEKFTAACNNMSVLGVFARHGPSKKPPPAAGKVMTDVDEAVLLMIETSYDVLQKLP